MKIKNRRIHIAGSAFSNCDLDKLKYAHSLVALLSKTFLEKGASLCAQVGKEPMHNADESTSVIFDWTIIQSVYHFVEGTSLEQYGTKLLPLTTLITEKTQVHVPEARKEEWRVLVQKPFVQILNHPKQWTAGAVRRDRIATVGDILFLLSGGEGVEHLAQLYVGQSKPVIAFDLDLGASTEKGPGRAVAINREIASNPQVYLSAERPEVIGALWENISTRDGTRPISEVVASVLSLLDALKCIRQDFI